MVESMAEESTGDELVTTVGGLRPRKGVVIVSSIASDSHTWNLVYLQLLIEELGYEVVNLGPCVPDAVLVEECRERAPDMVVISSVNGHGFQDGLRVIEQLRDCTQTARIPTVIGGKLGVSDSDSARYVDELMAAGFDAVFEDSAGGVAEFENFVRRIPRREPHQLDAAPVGENAEARVAEWT